MRMFFTEAESQSASDENMSCPSDIDHIVHEILPDMSLKQEAAIANMDEDGSEDCIEEAMDSCPTECITSVPPLNLMNRSKCWRD